MRVLLAALLLLFAEGFEPRLVTLPFPTGLRFTLPSAESPSVRCLLMQDSVKLRPGFEKVFVHLGILSPGECGHIIDSAEAYAARKGWTRNRHTGFPTTDIPLEWIYGSFSAMHGVVNSRVLPLLASSFPSLNEEYLKIDDLFVVKYDAREEGLQRSLGVHKDGTPWSFVIALNDPSEFDGGGTFFVDTDTLARPPHERGVGSCVVFSGQNRHCGTAITAGVRYVLTGFVLYQPPPAPEGPGPGPGAAFDPVFDGSASTIVEVGEALVGVALPPDSCALGRAGAREKGGGEEDEGIVDVRGWERERLEALLRRAFCPRSRSWRLLLGGGGRPAGEGGEREEEKEEEREREEEEREGLRRRRHRVLAVGKWFALDDQAPP